MSWEVQTMKSKTSSYKKTWLRKNLGRFMPFWVLYTLCLLLGLAMMSSSRDSFYYIMNLGECARIMAVVNCGYALLTAQLLFGDLYSSRMCYGIHALPLRREEMFSLNVLSGLLFSLAPTALMTLIALPMAIGSGVEKGALVPLLWFAAANLQYLFFFGLSLLCAFLAGNRFSMAVLYGILNFLSLLIYLLTESLYMPLLKGVMNPFEWFYLLCPVVKISSDPLILLERLQDNLPGTYEIQWTSWMYLLISAGMGILLLLLSLELYRKRSLETAGEFIAVKALKPVFSVLFAVFGAMGLNLIARMFFGYQEKTALAVSFAFIGLVAGWFVGLMLLERTSRVFQKKAFWGLGILLAVVSGSLLLTHLDVLHIASWVPRPEEVEKVYVIPGYQNYGEYWTNRESFALTKAEDLETVTSMHRLALGEDVGPEDVLWYYEPETPGEEKRYTVPVSIQYNLKDGKIRRRFYYIYAEGEAGDLAEALYSREPAVLENPRILEFRGFASYMNVNGHEVPMEYLAPEEIGQLMDAITQDCREGHMAQMQEFHPVPVWAEGDRVLPSLYLSVGAAEGPFSDSIGLDVYSDSTHTLNWLRQRGILSEVIEDARANGMY